jgi:hypothetical protein
MSPCLVCASKSRTKQNDGKNDQQMTHNWKIVGSSPTRVLCLKAYVTDIVGLDLKCIVMLIAENKELQLSSISNLSRSKCREIIFLCCLAPG